MLLIVGTNPDVNSTASSSAAGGWDDIFWQYYCP